MESLHSNSHEWKAAYKRRGGSGQGVVGEIPCCGTVIPIEHRWQIARLVFAGILSLKSTPSGWMPSRCYRSTRWPAAHFHSTLSN